MIDGPHQVDVDNSDFDLVPGKLYRATGPFIISTGDPAGRFSNRIRGFGKENGIVLAVSKNSFLHEERVWYVRGMDPKGIPYVARLERV